MIYKLNRIINFKISGLVFANMIGLLACSTKPVSYSASKQEGQWEAKAQIKNFKDESSTTVGLDVMAIKDRAMRIEVSGTLGIQLSSLLMKNEKILILVHPQKKAVFGDTSENALESVFKSAVNPRWLYGIFFDSPIEGWKCDGNPVSQCLGPKGESILWSEREGERKRVTLKGPDFFIQILVKSFQTKVQNPEKAFSLSVPDSYKKLKLN